MKRTHTGASPATAGAAPAKRKARPGHWSMQLKASMEDPTLVVESDDRTVTIKDAYPKARHHYLVMPRENISSFRQVTSDHLELLKHMLKRGNQLAEKLKTDTPSLRFRCGYHAVASMSQLHMHVISQDFDSPCLKTKKHWNSFTSEFFLDAEKVIEMLETKGVIRVDTEWYESLLKKALVCHVCHQEFPTMPKLKAHVLKHA